MKVPPSCQKLSMFLSFVLSFSLLLCQEVQFTAANMCFNWLSFGSLRPIFCHPATCWQLCFVDLPIIYLDFFFCFWWDIIFLEAFGPAGCQQLAHMEWQRIKYRTFHLNSQQKWDFGPLQTFQHYYLWSNEKKHRLKLQPSKDFLIQHRDQGWGASGRAFLDASTWSWTSHGRYFVISPVLRQSASEHIPTHLPPRWHLPFQAHIKHIQIRSLHKRRAKTPAPPALCR